MNKEVAKIVIYYTDGTYQEVQAIAAPKPYTGIRGPFEAQPATEPLPNPDDYYYPGKIGTWPHPPADTGIKIVD
jgi:hypothetical protein